MVSDEDNIKLLCAPFTDKEIADALFQIGPLKAPGPDARLDFFKSIGLLSKRISFSG